MKKILLLTGILLVATSPVAQQTFSPELKSASITDVCNAVADWQIANMDSVKHNPLDWTNGALYRGMVEWAKTIDNSKYFDFVATIGKTHNWNVWQRVYHADDICVGQAYIELYRRLGDKKILQSTLERAFYVANHPSEAPLNKLDPVGKDERWSWCDALFMAPPIYAALYTITGEEVYVSFMNTEYKVCVDSLYDSDAKLFYRDIKRIPLREPNGAKQFWGRGNGWVFSGLPLIIENLPENYPMRNYYIKLFKEMAVSILKTQDHNGAWHSSLLDLDNYPLPENSASAFFCHGFAWGINKGYLDAKAYRPALEKGWKSLVKYVNNEGRLGYIQAVGAAPNESVGEESTDVYGVGAFLLAGSELYRMTVANGK
ncbi:MAG: glycoside hydrolase family 88 protein [Dysgonamonadaceae bacterium]|jgi:rhamnogalacturonyl hydrolase YesR|nr:glycoside hydrolase family 88 protein [Dysgonamonadaceae bacterium]